MVVSLPPTASLLAGETRRRASFLVNENANEQYFNLRVCFRVPKRVSDWQLEYTLCSLQQHLQDHEFGLRCTVYDCDSPNGTDTEFWIITNCWYWSTRRDAELVNILTMFIDVNKSDIVVLPFSVPSSVLTSLSSPVQIEIEIPEEPEGSVPEPELSTPAPAKMALSELAISDPDSWAIDALAAAWAEIPSPDGVDSPLSVIDEEEEDERDDERYDEDEEEEEVVDDGDESPGLSRSTSPESSPESSPAISPLGSTASLPALSQGLADGWLGALLESWPDRWAGATCSFSSSSAPSSAGSSVPESVDTTPTPTERFVF